MCDFENELENKLTECETYFRPNLRNKSVLPENVIDCILFSKNVGFKKTNSSISLAICQLSLPCESLLENRSLYASKSSFTNFDFSAQLKTAQINPRELDAFYEKARRTLIHLIQVASTSNHSKRLAVARIHLKTLIKRFSSQIKSEEIQFDFDELLNNYTSTNNADVYFVIQYILPYRPNLVLKMIKLDPTWQIPDLNGFVSCLKTNKSVRFVIEWLGGYLMDTKIRVLFYGLCMQQKICVFKYFNELCSAFDLTETVESDIFLHLFDLISSETNIFPLLHGISMKHLHLLVDKYATKRNFTVLENLPCQNEVIKYLIVKYPRQYTQWHGSVLNAKGSDLIKIREELINFGLQRLYMNNADLWGVLYTRFNGFAALGATPHLVFSGNDVNAHGVYISQLRSKLLKMHFSDIFQSVCRSMNLDNMLSLVLKVGNILCVGDFNALSSSSDLITTFFNENIDEPALCSIMVLYASAVSDRELMGHAFRQLTKMVQSDLGNIFLGHALRAVDDMLLTKPVLPKNHDLCLEFMEALVKALVKDEFGEVEINSVLHVGSGKYEFRIGRLFYVIGKTQARAQLFFESVLHTVTIRMCKIHKENQRLNNKSSYTRPTLTLQI